MLKQVGSYSPLVSASESNCLKKSGQIQTIQTRSNQQETGERHMPLPGFPGFSHHFHEGGRGEEAANQRLAQAQCKPAGRVPANGQTGLPSWPSLKI